MNYRYHTRIENGKRVVYCPLCEVYMTDCGKADHGWHIAECFQCPKCKQVVEV